MFLLLLLLLLWNALEKLRGDEMTKLIAEWSVAGTLINEDPRRDCS